MGLERVSGSARKSKAYLCSCALELSKFETWTWWAEHLSIEKVSKTGVISALAYLWNPGTWTRGGQRRDRDHRLELLWTKKTCVQKLIMKTSWMSSMHLGGLVGNDLTGSKTSTKVSPRIGGAQAWPKMEQPKFKSRGWGLGVESQREDLPSTLIWRWLSMEVG